VDDQCGCKQDDVDELYGIRIIMTVFICDVCEVEITFEMDVGVVYTLATYAYLGGKRSS